MDNNLNMLQKNKESFLYDYSNWVNMLSTFLKKLLFVRQFFIIDGKIEVLGKRQVMLPKEVLSEVESSSTKLDYKKLKKIFMENIKDYAKKIGSGEEGMYKNMVDVFETFGLGRIEVLKSDNKKKTCVLRVHDCPILDGGNKSKILTAALSGMFSFLFSKDVNAEQLKTKKEVCEFQIK